VVDLELVVTAQLMQLELLVLGWTASEVDEQAWVNDWVCTCTNRVITAHQVYTGAGFIIIIIYLHNMQK